MSCSQEFYVKLGFDMDYQSTDCSHSTYEQSLGKFPCGSAMPAPTGAQVKDQFCFLAHMAGRSFECST